MDERLGSRNARMPPRFARTRKAGRRLLKRERGDRTAVEALQTAVELSQDAILFLDARSLRILDANPAASQLFAVPLESLPGQRLWELIPVLWQGSAAQSIASVRGHAGSAWAEQIVELPTGEIRLEMSQTATVSEAAGELLVVVARRCAGAVPCQPLLQRDWLTRLPLRDALERALARVLEQDSPDIAALLFIDLNHFKCVNDTLGHWAGDEVLRVVAQRLERAIRPTDLLVRYGGDEFVVLLEQASRFAAVKIAQRMQAELEAPVEVGGHALRVSASIGISVSSEHKSSEALIRAADAAMYRAKLENRQASACIAGHT